jgi:heme-degrading monooxygenase HmoA
MLQAIAIHHAHPEHADAFLEFMHRVIDHVGAAPGLIEFTAWREPGGTRLFGFSRWESADAFQAALPSIAGLSAERRPEWSDREDEVLLLAPA